jgi:hypothetical protein
VVNAALLAAFLYESPLTVLRATALLVVVTGASPSQHGDRRGGESNASAKGVGAPAHPPRYAEVFISLLKIIHLTAPLRPSIL